MPTGSLISRRCMAESPSAAGDARTLHTYDTGPPRDPADTSQMRAVLRMQTSETWTARGRIPAQVTAAAKGDKLCVKEGSMHCTASRIASQAWHLSRQLDGDRAPLVAALRLSKDCLTLRRQLCSLLQRRGDDGAIDKRP